MIDWDKIKYFTSNENWGNIKLVSPDLIYALDNYRDKLGYRVHISPVPGAVVALSTGHSEASYHYPVLHGSTIVRYGMAADIFPECALAYAWMQALRDYSFGGVGVYPYWEYPAKNLQGGLHLDIRSADEKILWWVGENGKYHWLRNTGNIKELLSTLIHIGE